MPDKNLREILEGIYFCGGDELRKKKAINQAKVEILKLVPTDFEIAHTLSGQQGVGAYTPEQLQKAHTIHVLILKKLGGK